MASQLRTLVTPQTPRLRHNVAWLAAGTVIYSGCQWLTLLAVARVSDSPSSVGLLSLGYAVAVPVFLFANLQLRSIYASDVRNAYHFADYVATRGITTVVALLAVGLIALLCYDESAASAVLTVGVVKAADAAGDLAQASFQRYEKMRLLGTSQAIRGLAALIALVTVMYVSRNLTLAILAMGAASIAVLFAFDLPGAIRLSRPRSGPVSKNGVLRLVVFATPLGAMVAGAALLQQLPIIVVQRVESADRFGLFAAVYAFVLALNVLVASAGEAILPRLASLASNSERRGFTELVMKASFGALGLGLAGGVTSAVVAEPALRLVFGPEYADGGWLLAVLLFGAAPGFPAFILTYAAIALRLHKALLACYVGMLAVATPLYVIVAKHGTGVSLAGALAGIGLGSSLLLSIVVACSLRRTSR